MARIRTVKPDFYRHEGLQDIEVANPGSYAMLVFQGLWGHCDSQGVFEYRPRHLKLDILPFLPFDMEATLALLVEAGFVKRYEVDGKQYGIIETFTTHQRLSGKESGEAGVKHPLPQKRTAKAPVNRTDSTQDQPVKQEGSNGEATGKHPESQERSNGRERSIGKEKEGGCGGKPLPEPVLAEPPDGSDPLDPAPIQAEVVDDVGLVMACVNQFLSPRFTREANEQFIKPRLNAGATVEEMCLVVQWKLAQWGDGEMRRNLHPECLFRKAHWERYLLEAQDWHDQGRPRVSVRNGSTNPAQKLALLEGSA